MHGFKHRFGTGRRMGPPAERYPSAAPGWGPILAWSALGAVLLAPAMVWLASGGARGGWRRGRKVGDVMVRDVVAVPPSATLAEAARRMRDANVGALPVVVDGQVRGMITDRDLVVRGMARGLDAATATVAECATTQVACARPEWDVEQAMEVMTQCQVGRLPVVGDDNRLIGMVTLSSLALRSSEQDEAFETAQEVSRRSSRFVSGTR
ncbi:MAG TPA: CBS domain-containing protein [Candidatus Binatia bacterium]|nr:CBS domain-containing protein [Candidatus Binatia bacterium]